MPVGACTCTRSLTVFHLCLPRVLILMFRPCSEIPLEKMADPLKVQMIAAGECARAYYTRYQNFTLHATYNDIHRGPLG
jgi:hypothetical protein